MMTEEQTPHDPETGELLEEPMDGEVIDPPQSFGHFITTVANGEANGELSIQLQRLVQNLRDESTVSGGKEKGALTLKIDLEIENEMMFIKYDIKRKDPQPKRGRSVAFHTVDGHLLPQDPRQQELPLKVASFARPLKNT